MPHLAAGPRFALAVEVEVGAGLGDQSRPSARRRRRSDFPSSRRPITSDGSPSGRPQMARTCCSNCEVSAPSIVQWPLLWTRGAISLTIGPSAQAKNSTVSTPTWPSARRSALAEAIASSAWPRSPGPPGRSRCAGCRLHARCGSAGRRDVSPFAVRARITLNSASKLDPRLGDGRLAADRVPGRRRPRSARWTQAWPLPS